MPSETHYLCEEKLDNFQSKLWLRLKDFLRNVNESAKWENFNALILKHGKTICQSMVVVETWLKPNRPETDVLTKNFAETGKCCEVFNVRMYLICLALVSLAMCDYAL